MKTHELLDRARRTASPKRYPSLPDFQRWLQDLADNGVLARSGDDWTPTPGGALWLASCFPVDGDEAVSA